ncbi:MAG: NAD(P)-dependent oxidoreductase [Clostridium sp.]
MHGNNREDFLEGELAVFMLSTISKKLKIGVIGGGKASLIKCKTLIKNGCKIEVVSKEFNEEFKSFKEVKLIEGSYYKDFLKDKHLIIIAVNCDNTINEIVRDCIDEFKLFINCTNPFDGNCTIPAQRSGENFKVGVTIKNGNPKSAVFGVETAKKELSTFDEYFGLTSKLRNKAKLLNNEKKQLLNFIGSDDFLYFYNRKKEKLVLQLFYEREIIENLYKD